MSEISNKSKIEFRCRPVRSSSCSGQSKITAKLSNTPTIKNNRKIVLNVPKKILALTLTQKSKLTVSINSNSQINNHEYLQNQYQNLNHNNLAQTSTCTFKHKNGYSTQPKQYLLNQDQNQVELGRLSQLDYQNQCLQQCQCSNLDQHNTNQRKHSYQHHQQQEQCQDRDEHQSKATMKNGIINKLHQNIINKSNNNENSNRLQIKQRSHSIDQSKQIKSMLMELADGHQQMMAMLKCIMKKQGYNYHVQQPCHIQQAVNSSSNVSTHNRKLSYTKVINQTIYSTPYSNNQTHQPQSQTQSSNPLSLCFPISTAMQSSVQSTRSKFINPYMANILVQVLSQKLPYAHLNNTNSMILAQMEIRELVSRRFQAFGLKYQYVIQAAMQYRDNQEKKQKQINKLIKREQQTITKSKKDRNYDKRSISKSDMKTMLLQWPYLLTEQQVSIVWRCLSNTNKTLTTTAYNSPHPQSVSISQVCYKLRYFFYPRTQFPEQPSLLRLKITQLKSLIVHKSFQLQQLLINSTQSSGCQDGSRDYIELSCLQNILKQSKFQPAQIQLLVAGLCVTARSTTSIQWKMIIDGRWAAKLLQYYPKTSVLLGNSKHIPADANINNNNNINVNEMQHTSSKTIANLQLCKMESVEQSVSDKISKSQKQII